MKQFWMIYVDGKTGCTEKHLTLEDAKKEAERLATLEGNRGRKVFILKSTLCCYITAPITWGTIEDGRGR